jgi:predicted acylesterase/phospholipase RssA
VDIPRQRVSPEHPRLSVAFGGGGLFGIGYGLGVADALADAGIGIASAPLLGTSAGSWVAACVTTGVGCARLLEVPAIRIPNLKPGFLRGVARDVFGDARSAQVRASAVRLPTGRRALLRGDHHDLADLVAASSAVPGLFAPARVGNALYVDGGVRSLVSADLAKPAHDLVVVAPVAGPMFGAAGAATELMLRRELNRWQNATGGTAHLIRPNTVVASLARQPLHLFDKGRAEQVYPLGYMQARQLLAERPALAALACDPVAA